MLTIPDLDRIEHTMEQEQRRLAAIATRHPALCRCHLCAVHSLLDDVLWTLAQERARLAARDEELT
jgi:hypothetical protein